VAHKRKEIKAVKTHLNGYDLMIERDAGNLIRVITGPEKLSRETWSRLANLCEQVLYEFDNETPNNRLINVEG